MSGIVKHSSVFPNVLRKTRRGLQRPVGRNISLFEELADYNRSMFNLIPRYSEYAIPKLDMRDDGCKYVVEVEAPGYAEDSLEVTIDGHQMTIRGESNYDNKDEESEGKYLVREVSRRSFVRTLDLPREADTGEAVASLRDGILRLDVPKISSASEPKKLTINK